MTDESQPDGVEDPRPDQDEQALAGTGQYQPGPAIWKGLLLALAIVGGVSSISYYTVAMLLNSDEKAKDEIGLTQLLQKKHDDSENKRESTDPPQPAQLRLEVVLQSVQPPQLDGTAGAQYGLTYNDFRRLSETIPGLVSITPVRTSTMQVRQGDNMATARIVGSVPSISDLYQLDMARGRFLVKRDDGKKVAVIGPSVAEKLFPDELPIGKTIYIGDEFYVILGQTKGSNSKSVLPAGIEGGTDSDIYIPLITMRRRLGELAVISNAEKKSTFKLELSQIWIELNKQTGDVDAMVTIIDKLLDRFHEHDDYTIILGHLARLMSKEK